MSTAEEKSIEDAVPEIVKNTMQNEMLKDAVKWANVGIKKHVVDKDIAGLLKANFDAKYSGAWYVSSHRKPCHASAHSIPTSFLSYSSCMR